MISRKRIIKKLTAVLLTVCVSLTAQAFPLLAKEAEQSENTLSAGAVLEPDYRKVRTGYKMPVYSGKTLSFSVADAVVDKSLVTSGTHGLVGNSVTVNQGKSADFSVYLPEDGQYAVTVKYFDASDSTLPVSCGVLFDGGYPCYEMRSQKFESEWHYGKEGFSADRYGNEIVPESERIEEWREKYLCDSLCLTVEPFLFELEKGAHRLTFSCTQGSLEIAEISFGAKPVTENIKTGKPEGSEIKIIEGESFSEKNDATVRPSGEYDASLYPYSYSNMKLNMLSGSSFSEGGQSVTYSFNVDKSGYYYLAFRYRQSTKTDFPVFRYAYLDGKQCSDMKNIAFNYAKDFTDMTLTDKNGEPYGVYLEKDTEHTLTLKVSLENMADIIDTVKGIIDEINDMSLKIMKITGNNTSKYRDFDVASYIPEIEEKLNYWADKTEKVYEQLHEFNKSVKIVGEFSTLKICVKQLRSMAADIDNLPKRIDELYQGDSSVGQYLANTYENLYSSPLAIDRIFIYQDKADIPSQKGFFYKTVMSFCRFLSSFSNDYNQESADNKEKLKIWVNRSRLYIELMQKMADNGFYGETGITADFSLMPNEEKLVLATASGNAPDVALGVTYTIPFELAIRGALCDLSKLEGWDEISSRFSKGIVNIGAMDGGFYLLPETSDFLVLFYRSDILNELGLKVPDTMEDVKDMLPTLKRYGMDFYSHIAGHGGTKTLSVLVPFIYQMGGRVYGKIPRELMVTSEKTVAAFSEMADFFTVYDVPYEISNFYQHFRSGELPVGVSGFNTYMTLLNSAPEIANSWSLAPYPGYKDESGTVRRYISGAQSTAVIFSSSEKTDSAWKFLEWWTRADTQSEFADTLQLTYGNEFMWNTANLEAFGKLPWNEEHKTAILEMMKWIVEVPRVPGNYMTQRSLSNALNNIVLSGANVRQELYEAGKDIREEVDSKLEEFGYIKDGQVISDYKITETEAVK